MRLAPDERREMLLACLEEVVASKGYQAATVPDVVARASVAQGCFYRYFRNIDEAFLEAVRRVLSVLERAADDLDFSHVHDAHDLEAELTRYFRVLGNVIGEHPALLRDALLVAPAAPGQVGVETSAFLEQMHAVACRLLDAHTGRPPFRRLDAGVAAAAIVGMVLGGAREAIRLGNDFDPERWAVEIARFEAGALTGPSSAPVPHRGSAGSWHGSPMRRGGAT